MKQSDIADLAFALSSSNTDGMFNLPCSHSHEKRCVSCMELASALQEIQQAAHNWHWENSDAVMFKVDKAVEDIRNLQKHIIRAKNQEAARSECVSTMLNNDVVITCDWAMKFLPRKYREGQVDWFAKRGINWHVSVTLMKIKGVYETVTHIHIFSSQTTQDAAVTTAVICDVINDIANMVPDLNKVHLFSDNAGCYKSSLTMTTLKKECGSKIASYNFSEAQNGKGPCDRKAAHAKSVIKRYVNEGKDVTSAAEMKMSLDKAQNKSYRVRVVDGIFNLDAVKNVGVIQNISSFFNFQFEDSGLRVWQAFGIGQGKLIPWTVLKPSKSQVELKVIGDWSDVSLRRFVEEEPEHPVIEEEEAPSEGHAGTEKTLFFCTNDGCVRQFKNSQCLEDHLLLGNYDFQLERFHLSDKAKLFYAQKLTDINTRSLTMNTKETTSNNSDNIKEGWALKQKKKKTVFTKQQKAFMIEKFNVGKRTGSKIDPDDAAEEMMTCRLFAKEHFLSAQQIGSFFARLSQQDRKTDLLDFTAANEEDSKLKLKNEILSVI